MTVDCRWFDSTLNEAMPETILQLWNQEAKCRLKVVSKSGENALRNDRFVPFRD